MSYQVLARKWRPQKLQDVVGQEHVVRSLINSILNDRIGHAYIFSGTRGIGKTSVARLFAKSLRCLDQLDDGNACGKCKTCNDSNTNSSMNVIEIDGASNNSVDDVRDLIGNIQYLPTIGKYKVYIIDEVHMLSTSAFNALLKTLEEPPKHAVFILATTEPEKLLGTVLSRCQRFDFRNADMKDLVSHIKKIAVAEKINFENDNLITELAKLGNGSFRDTLSLLDQVLSFSENNNITENIFSKSLGVAKLKTIKEIIDAIVDGDVENLSTAYRSSLFENVTANNMAKSILESMFSIIMAKDYNDPARVSSKIDSAIFDSTSRAQFYWIYEVLTNDLAWAVVSICPEDAIEIAFRKVALRNDFMAEVGGAHVAQGKSPAPKVDSHHSKIEIPKVVEKSEPQTIEEISSRVEIKAIRITLPEKKEVEAQKTEVIETINKVDENKDKSWNGFLNYLRKDSPASSSNLEQGNLINPISFDGKFLKVELGFPLSAEVFFDYLNETEANNKLISNLIKFFEIDLKNLELKLTLVDKKMAIEKDFKSKVEIKHEKELRNIKDKEDEIANDPMIKHAENIFNSKIDKITLTEKE